MTSERWPLPTGWNWRKAGEIADVVGGGTPATDDLANFEDSGVAWVTPADLTDYKGTYIERGRRSLSKKGYASCGAQLLPAGAILYSSRAPIGYCCIASAPVATNQGFKSLVLRDGSISEFVRYYLVASKEYAQSLASGTTFKELSGTRMAQLSIPVAPVPKQRNIVAKLDLLFKRSTEAHSELSRVPDLVRRYKAAVLGAAFRGELTADWRKRNPSVGDGDELLKRLVSSRADSGGKKNAGREIDILPPQDLHELPYGWTWCPVSVLATKVSDGVHKKPDYVPDGVPFLTVRNLTAGEGISFDGCRFVTRTDHEEFIKRTRPERGDILISKDGTLGVVRAVRTDIEFSIFVSVALVKPLDRSMTDYLELAFTAPQVQEQMVGVGTGLQHIHLTDLRRDYIPIAPPDERAELVALVRRAFAHVERLQTETDRATRLLDRIEQATLDKAFHGELIA